MSEDLDYVAELEVAISKKYGEAAVRDPATYWDATLEDSYLKQKKEQIRRKDQSLDDNKKEALSDKRLLNTTINNRSCPECVRYSFSIRDDVYMLKYSCCYECFIQFVEGREEAWRKRE